MAKDFSSQVKHDAALQLFVERYTDIGARWVAKNESVEKAQQDIDAAMKWIDGQREEMSALLDEGMQLREAAALLGLDLVKAYHAQGNNQGMDSAPRSPPPKTRVPSTFSVKDFVLEEAHQAYPKPVRAAELQKKIKDLGHDIHSKTIGMSLYRWSQRGSVRRDGWDWYFVPTVDQETIGEAAGSLAESDFDDFA